VLDYEHVFVDALPSAERYERSYMHRDRVTHTVVCPNTDFIVTGRCGGVH
jgi:peptidylprolyl isomerase domain and WD repeat-containing protein 1